MYRGVFVAVITPFKDGKIDREALQSHVNWLVSEGVHGIVPCGTTGEAATLSHAEYADVVRTACSAVNGRCPVIAGAGTNSTANSIELARLVVEAGADATLLVTPYYNKPTQAGLFEHFRTIAAEVNAPHILYNVPGRTAVNMLPETVEKLSRIKNIVGIKEASGDLSQAEKIKKLVPDSFSILSGNDDINLEIYRRGGCGAISVTANIAPKKVAEVWNNFAAGKDAQAGRFQEALQELNKAMFIETNPIPVKTAAALMGKCREEFRLPMTKMGGENKERLKRVLKEYGF